MANSTLGEYAVARPRQGRAWGTVAAWNFGGSGVRLGSMGERRGRLGSTGESRGSATPRRLRRWRLCSACHGEESITSDEEVGLSCTRQWHCGSSPQGRRRRCARLGTVGKAQRHLAPAMQRQWGRAHRQCSVAQWWEEAAPSSAISTAMTSLNLMAHGNDWRRQRWGEEKRRSAATGQFIMHMEDDTATGGRQVEGWRRQVGLVSSSAPLTGGPHHNCFPTQKNNCWNGIIHGENS
jgi:hypothetical protein